MCNFYTQCIISTFILVLAVTPSSRLCLTDLRHAHATPASSTLCSLYLYALTWHLVLIQYTPQQLGLCLPIGVGMVFYLVLLSGNFCCQFAHSLIVNVLNTKIRLCKKCDKYEVCPCFMALSKLTYGHCQLQLVRTLMIDLFTFGQFVVCLCHMC